MTSRAIIQAAASTRKPQDVLDARKPKVAHTPGPWTYFVGNANGRGLIRVEVCGSAPENCGHHIASLTRGAGNEANARLMAAAPAMLIALQEIIRESDKLSEREFRLAAAAISYATGVS